ncbi:MAG TPA: tetratricopeptide repeat protein [Polyangia bacterium]|nr:tetratricopeptide repeat protein [Polyangia bacterium]
MLFVPLTLREIRLGFSVFAAVLLLVTTFAGQAAAADEDNPNVEKVTALNKKALDLYNDLEFEESRKVLKQALDLCSSSGLDRHPIAARTHIHMGVVLIAAKQQELGVKQFRTALDIQPDIQVTKALANPEILEAFKEAAASMPEAPKDGGGAAPSGGAAEEVVKGIKHNPTGRGRKGKAIPIIATIGDDVTGYTKVMLEYRPEGAPEYLEREMKKSGNKYVGEIPADATEGNIVSYYIEADSDDENADSIATSGSEDRPYNVSLTGAAKEGGDNGGGGGGCEGDDCEEEAGPPIFIGVMGGLGYGFTTGFGEINDHNKVNPGFASAAVAQIAPEIGYFISPTFRLSLQIRYQMVSGTTPLNLDKYLTPAYQEMYPKDVEKCGTDHLCSTQTSSAVAVLARGTWFYGSDMVRPYFSLALGGGAIRHLVHFTSSLGKVCGKNGDQECVDTVLAGPVFAGPGAGVLIAIMPNFGFLLDLTSVIGFPKFTYNLDVNGGVSLRF